MQRVDHMGFSPKELDWLAQLRMEVMKGHSNFDFTAKQLATRMAMSKRSLEMKMKELLGSSPRKYIQDVRFHEALRLLENKEVDSVKELSFRVGMRDRANFSRQFKKRFGRLPSKYL